MGFQKWQACGNDFIISESRKHKPFSIYSVKICDRHYGVGADGVLRIDPSDVADCKMTVINASGTEAEMCGNGIRCVGQYMSNKLGKSLITVETKAGLKEVRIEKPYERIAVDMGKAEVKWNGEIELPEAVVARAARSMKSPKAKVFKNANFVDIGNPHCVLLVEEEEASRGAVMRYGRRIEQMTDLFPNGTNVEFVTFLGGNEIRVKVWERGVGRTLACGTGACASAYVAYQSGILGNNKTVHVKLDGGHVDVKLGETIELTGPARHICTGEYLLEAEDTPSEE